MLVQGVGGGESRESWSARMYRETEGKDEDELSKVLVPGWFSEMLDADSFIVANLTALKV